MICGLELVAFGAVGAIKGFDGAQMQDKVGVQYEWITPEDGSEPVISAVENSVDDYIYGIIGFLYKLQVEDKK